MTNQTSEVIFPGGDGTTERRLRRKRGVRTTRTEYYISEPGTPNLSETADQIRRTLSFASIDSLVLLSNDAQERQRVLAAAAQAGRDLVWRAKDEKTLYPPDPERAVVLAARRGLRSFILAYSVRAGFNIVLLLFRALRKRPKLRFSMIVRALFGEESFRFGGMIGAFTFLNTLTLHLLRLAPPLSYIRRRIRAGLFRRTTFGPPEREGSEGEHRWHAAVAGAVGSLGILVESAERRRGVVQQMFVRGLQGSFNQYAPKLGIRIPNGDVLLFGLCCGQIMFAFLLAPETIPREYNNWIQGVSFVPKFAVKGNLQAMRNDKVDLSLIEEALNYKHLTPHNRTELTTMLHNAQNDIAAGFFIPCAMTHPFVDSCIRCNFNRFFQVFRQMLPVYSALHIIPMLVLRRHQVFNHPLKMFGKAGWGITRSCSFLGLFVVIYQVLFCSRTNALEAKISPILRALLERKETMWAIGFSTCLSLFAEEKRRRAELAMYCLPKALESAWFTARKRSWVPIVPFGEALLGAAGMAMVMDAYKHKPSALSGVVSRLMYQLVGPM
ncbi:hypothetical protein VHUM_00375 [Vanrija humicola]|uniref:Transmembrane protein 135 N-terminal domain-containing protein n=1 Tax=Vanrija humicola TaxID=5417 RepID=A0A7D8V4D1_VANHU|nr:hypothetical protein VHUM_00375 [Vanrija humicola]